MSKSEQQNQEIRLRILHDFLYEAMNFPGLASNYTPFIRSLRERLHPVGVTEYEVAKLANGLKFKVDLGDRLGCDIYYGFYQEYFDSQLMFNLLHPGSIFLDIGANFGYWAVNVAKLTNGVVHAFEPDAAAYSLLEENVIKNGLQAIVACHQVAVGAENGETDFYVCQESSFSSMSPTGRAQLQEKVKISVSSLDTVLPQWGLSQIDGMKIDVEGHEFAVLQGGIETIKNSPTLIIMLEISAKNLNQERKEALINALSNVYQLGFRGWVVDVDALRLISNAEEAASLASANLFLTLADSEREQELKKKYKDLQKGAFQGIAQEIGLSAEVLLKRNLADPYGYYQLYGALVNRLMRDRDATINELQEKIAQLKQQSKHELELHQRDFKLLESKRDAEFDKFKGEIARLEKESQARLKEVRKRDERIVQLQQEVEKLRTELNLPMSEKIVRKLKKNLKQNN